MKGYKHTELGWIPEDWEVKKIDVLAEKVGSGITPRGGEKIYKKVGRPFVRSQNVGWGDLILTDVAFIDDETHRSFNSTEIKLDDVFLNITGASIGRSAVADKRILGGNVNQHVCIIRTKKEFLFPKFLNAYLISTKGKNLIESFQAGGNRQGLNYDQIRSFTVPLPSIEEQKEISKILSTWDKSIEALTQLIAAKQQLKKGLMQHLLTGKKRLPGFKGKWGHVHLGSLGEPYTGLVGKTSVDFGSGQPFIPYLNIFSNSRVDLSFLGYVKVSSAESQNKVRYGDMFFTVSSETPEEVGMASVLLDEVEEMYLNSFCFGFRLKNFKTLLPEFARYYMRSSVVKLELNKLAQGSTRFNLSKNELMKIHLYIPSDVDEQRSIAKVLSTSDDEIKTLETQLNIYKQQKQGLMQQLLTGKKRVKV